MLLAPALFTLPLLASAIPTSTFDSLTIQDQDFIAAVPEYAEKLGWTMDLNEMRLVQFSDEAPPIWVSELEKIQARAEGKNFMDITEHPTLGVSTFMLPSAANVKYSYPSPGNYTERTKSVIKGLDLDNMKQFLSKLSSFRTRYYRSDTGKQSQRWLKSHLDAIAQHHPGLTVTEFPHPWGQNSIIAHFAPASSDMADKPVTIIGAHQDSANVWPFLPAPGADDDGSGTTSSVEALRALAAANFTPSTPVEFMYFSAEEGGLLGSQAIAKSYEDKGVNVLAMLQMDMTAWVKRGTKESVGIIQDFVDPGLTQFIYDLAEEYLAISPLRTQCGYACSDHASFGKAGFQSAFVIESSFEDSNHYIHSIEDTMDHPEFSFTHMREFSKLAVAFAIELAASEKA